MRLFFLERLCVPIPFRVASRNMSDRTSYELLKEKKVTMMKGKLVVVDYGDSCDSSQTSLLGVVGAVAT